MTTPHAATAAALACPVCGQTMQLARVSPVSARESYEFWTCAGCGHNHVRAVHMTLHQDEREPPP